MIKYKLSEFWIIYDKLEISDDLIAAKAALSTLRSIPYQKSWADWMQALQLKREVAGTLRIEGADFTEDELETALNETVEQLHTRSQRQAAATVKAYRWIASLPEDRPINEQLILEIHNLIIRDADDDHCPPGKTRGRDQNVAFGIPRHRGVEGGDECTHAFKDLCRAIQNEFEFHDPLVQALAAHYHLAAMHPFLDGNGRLARALEALLLQRVGLRDTLFIAMSNFYYEEKNKYLDSLAKVRSLNHDLTMFLKFGLQGITIQCNRLIEEIKKNISKALFKDVMYSLFNRMRNERKRVIAKRQVEILKLLLEKDYTFSELTKITALFYSSLKNPIKALIRDINSLIRLGTIGCNKLEKNEYRLWVRLEWPTEITETEFFKSLEQLPKTKTYNILS